MLVELDITNFTLIEHVCLRFAGGFTVLTGETGAGKSILLGALGMALGERTSPDVIRNGCQSTRVQARFNIKQIDLISQMVESLGIPIEDGELVVDRELTINGKNISRANGVLLTVANLKQLTASLVVNSGQHDQQRLMEPVRQMNWFDNSIDTLRRARELAQVAYSTWNNLDTELRRLANTSREREREIDLLTYQLDEINNARLEPNEEKQIEEQLALSSNLDRRRTLAETVYTGVEQRNLSNFIRDADRLMVLDSALSHINEQLQTAEFMLADIAYELKGYIESIENDSCDVQSLETRRQAIKDLKRKYGSSVEEVLQFCTDGSDKLATLHENTYLLGSLESEVSQAWDVFSEAAKNLSVCRLTSANPFSRKIEERLHHLAMTAAEFHVHLEPSDPSSSGVENVQFLFSPNPGEPPKPLGKVASGGELSRVLLALTAELAEVDMTPVYVFDEIDAGIGGVTAHAVASTLVSLSQHGQVLCISHLPVVAAAAKQQFVIEKIVTAGRTFVNIREVIADERAHELARMMAGKLDSVTLATARQLLEDA